MRLTFTFALSTSAALLSAGCAQSGNVTGPREPSGSFINASHRLRCRLVHKKATITALPLAVAGELALGVQISGPTDSSLRR